MPTANDYFIRLAKDEVKTANMYFVIKRIKQDGITNPIGIASVLSIVSKESDFIPQVEKDYSHTDVSRIREVFPSLTNGVSDAFLETTKADPVKWFNWLYGGKNGNRPDTDDGYTFRGRFLNQATFRNLYEKLSRQLNLPELLTNPDKYNSDLQVSADVLIQYYKNGFEAAKSTMLFVEDRKIGVTRTTRSFIQQYGAADLNAFTDLQKAVTASYHCNAGLGRTIEYITRDHTTGLAKASSRAPHFLEIVKKAA